MFILLGIMHIVYENIVCDDICCDDGEYQMLANTDMQLRQNVDKQKRISPGKIEQT